MQRTLVRSLTLLLLLPGIAAAHTGVGTTTGFIHGFAHPLGGVDHLLAMLAVGLWAAQIGGRAVWTVPATFVAVMILGGALGFSGLAVPYIEEGILLSVLVLGLLVAASFRFSLPASMLTVALFAVFHGHAHGAEMPLAAGAAAYTAGFALATALLHFAGIGFGLLARKINIEKATRVAGSAIALGGLYLAIA